MASFTAFARADFDFFISEDDDHRPVLREKLLEFGRLVQAALPNEIRSRYGELHVGRVVGGRNANETLRAWLRLGKSAPSNPADRFARCNFTIELEAGALSFNAVIRDGRVTNPATPLGVLYRRIVENQAGVEAYLRGLGADFGLLVFVRSGRGGRRIMPGSEEWRLAFLQRLDNVVPELMPMFLALLRAITFPGIHLRRELARQTVLAITADQLAAEGARALVLVYPFLRFLEEGVLQRPAP